MNEFEKEKNILDGIEAEKKIKLNKVDWKNSEEVSIMKADKTAGIKRRLLDRAVPTRVCPRCRRRIIADSSWVIKNDIVICRSCSLVGDKRDEDEKRGGFIIGEATIRFPFDGWQIRVLRERAGVGLHSFAERMGWGISYQTDIETNRVKCLRLEVVEKMIGVFEDIGITISDSLYI